MGVVFTVVPSEFEEYLDHARTPSEVAIELGMGKTQWVAEKYPEAIIIGGDTIVTVDGEQLAKAADIEEARSMLRKQAGKKVLITSSIVVLCKATGQVLKDAAETEVIFKPYDDQAVEAYLQTYDWEDKAGGFGVQSGAAPLLSHMVGHYDTVVGLPTHILQKQLAQLGITSKVVELPPPIPQELPAE
jgi:septum formation protein